MSTVMILFSHLCSFLNSHLHSFFQMWLTQVLTHQLSTSPQLLSMIFKCASPL